MKQRDYFLCNPTYIFNFVFFFFKTYSPVMILFSILCFHYTIFKLRFSASHLWPFIMSIFWLLTFCSIGFSGFLALRDAILSDLKWLQHLICTMGCVSTVRCFYGWLHYYFSLKSVSWFAVNLRVSSLPLVLVPDNAVSGCRILVPQYGFMHLELIPMLVGFFTYKIATFVQAIEEALTVGEKETQV